HFFCRVRAFSLEPNRLTCLGRNNQHPSEGLQHVADEEVAHLHHFWCLTRLSARLFLAIALYFPGGQLLRKDSVEFRLDAGIEPGTKFLTVQLPIGSAVPLVPVLAPESKGIPPSLHALRKKEYPRQTMGIIVRFGQFRIPSQQTTAHLVLLVGIREL